MFKKFALSAAAALAMTATTVGIAQADQYDRRFIYRNMSNQTIEQFHATNTGNPHWGRDRLGSSVLEPGESVIFNLEDGSGYCRFDFLSVTASGQRIEKRNVDVCTIVRYTMR